VQASPARTVLVVDDEPAIRMLCRLNLELEGFRVLEADGIAAARSILESEDVAVLLVDVHLGEGDGRDLVRELRARAAALRIALLTGTTELAPDERAGADAVIDKPFTLDALVSTVRTLAADVDSSMT
jgi:DNA-binding response OmpR family regulator